MKLINEHLSPHDQVYIKDQIKSEDTDDLGRCQVKHCIQNATCLGMCKHHLFRYTQIESPKINKTPPQNHAIRLQIPAPPPAAEPEPEEPEGKYHFDLYGSEDKDQEPELAPTPPFAGGEPEAEEPEATKAKKGENAKKPTKAKKGGMTPEEIMAMFSRK